MKRNVLLTLIALLFLTVAAVGGYVLITKSNASKGTLVLNVKPANSTIKIDGNKRGQGKNLLAPGRYELNITRSGFKDLTMTVDITEGVTLTKNISLKANSAEGYAWIKEHPEDALQGEIIDPQSEQEISNSLKTNPIIANLPYRSSIYNIDISNDSGGGLVLLISANSALGRQVALEKIRSWGFDPTDYAITFKDFTNPFNATAPGAKQ